MAKKRIMKETKPLKGKPKEVEREEPEPVVEPPSAKKKGRKIAKGASDITVFSASFEKRMGQFREFYRDFLEKKAEPEGDMGEEMGEVAKRVSTKIEEACSAVLRENLREAEEWIGEQQKSVQEQIEKIENAHHETKNTLALTGTFSEAEIDGQLRLIQQKKAALQAVYDDYDGLREHAARLGAPFID